MNEINNGVDAADNGSTASTQPLEPLLNIRQAADAAGLKYWLLLRAVNRGDIPTYQFSNRRRRVRLSDIEAAIQAHRSRGSNVPASGASDHLSADQ